MIRWTDDPTAESIAAARQAQQAERQQITVATGLRIQDDGRIVRSARVLIGCPYAGCRYVASAQRQSQGLRSLAAHVGRVHHRQE